MFYILESSAGPVACPGPPARCVIRRRQCWGSVLGANTSAFPKVGATALRSNQNPIDCLAPAEGTPWEPIIGAVEQLDFQYFDDDGAEIAVPLTLATSGTVRRIDVTVTVARTSPANGDTLRQRMTRGFWVNNAAGRLGGGKP